MDGNYSDSAAPMIPDVAAGRLDGHFAANATSLPVTECGQCGHGIRLNAVVEHGDAAPWRCVECRTVVYGAASQDMGETLSVVRVSSDERIVAEREPSATSEPASAPSPCVQQLVQATAGKRFIGIERRRNPRYGAAIPALAIPLDERFQVAGPAIAVTTTNVSHSGIAVVHRQALLASYYALDFTTSGLPMFQAILKPTRATPLGAVYEVGGRFIERLIGPAPADEQPSSSAVAK